MFIWSRTMIVLRSVLFPLYLVVARNNTMNASPVVESMFINLHTKNSMDFFFFFLVTLLVPTIIYLFYHPIVIISLTPSLCLHMFVVFLAHTFVLIAYSLLPFFYPSSHLFYSYYRYLFITSN
ncbi:uncharacterized protein BX664DRAFT_321269 [Halteromyces radiatus]|uniref:uncharacterized protein n=1 Tax=Halteromyces radiatus TaxID=101107 RepID=UPI00221F7EEE|nr:uncharacterized protein BX664DRAFT_321269 [Halteromyces radiatus]KAI8099447.1 hypothetical protein BX664DRAFT_321269 [Halteromyces radiatus]